ncbi:MAG: hypothetical protein F7C34_04425 [Desulfurococcales archaeon]|nr:hypothetical protein [Desulfurococcales archaeon]
MIKTLQKLAEDAARVIERLNTYGSLGRGIHAHILAAAILTFAVSTSDSLLAWLAAAAYSISLLPAARRSAREVLVLVTYLAILAGTVGLPLLVTGNNSASNIGELYRIVPAREWAWESYLRFVGRIILAPLPLVMLVYAAGWPRIASYLYRLRPTRKIVGMLSLMLLLLPRALRNLFAMVAAREARTLTPSMWREWKLLAGALGDFIIDSTGYSRKLEMAIRARTFGEHPFEVHG